MFDLNLRIPSGAEQCADYQQHLASAEYRRLYNQAAGLYRRMCLRGSISRLWAELLGRSTWLLNLETVRRNGSAGQYFDGTYPVALDRIWGSEGRCRDFDRGFYPCQQHTRERWIGIAMAVLAGTSLPAVSLAQVGNVYFVRDGHHRISVARALGWEFIDADVTVCAGARLLPWTEASAVAQPLQGIPVPA